MADNHLLQRLWAFCVNRYTGGALFVVFACWGLHTLWSSRLGSGDSPWVGKIFVSGFFLFFAWHGVRLLLKNWKSWATIEATIEKALPHVFMFLFCLVLAPAFAWMAWKILSDLRPSQHSLVEIFLVSGFIFLLGCFVLGFLQKIVRDLRLVWKLLSRTGGPSQDCPPTSSSSAPSASSPSSPSSPPPSEDVDAEAMFALFEAVRPIVGVYGDLLAEVFSSQHYGLCSQLPHSKVTIRGAIKIMYCLIHEPTVLAVILQRHPQYAPAMLDGKLALDLRESMRALPRFLSDDEYAMMTDWQAVLAEGKALQVLPEEERIPGTAYRLAQRIVSMDMQTVLALQQWIWQEQDEYDDLEAFRDRGLFYAEGLMLFSEFLHGNHRNP